jgi:hypothetical protein
MESPPPVPDISTGLVRGSERATELTQNRTNPVTSAEIELYAMERATRIAAALPIADETPVTDDAQTGRIA